MLNNFSISNMTLLYCNSASLKKWITSGVAVLFILLFVYAAVSKLIDYENFTLQLAQSLLLSAFAPVIAWLVPFTEFAIAILLVIPRFRIFALYASFLLMVMFSGYIFIILNFTDFIPCSCGGVLEKLGWTEHLIFNIIFALFAAAAIVVGVRKVFPRKLLMLCLLCVVGLGTVSLLYVFSENEMHRNNAFQRRYIPEPLDLLKEILLEGNSYYIAGMEPEKIYLGNYNAPLYLDEVDIKTGTISKFRVTVSNTTLPYRRVRIAVKAPYYYLGDGTVPILFRGTIEERKARPYYEEAYFTHFTLADTSRIGLVSISANSGNTTLGVLHKEKEKLGHTFNDSIISEQVEGVIDADGSLLWNAQNQTFIYVYRYRNSFEVMDAQLKHLFTGRTIDTISEAILDLAYYKDTAQYKLGAKSVVVNKASTTYGDYLFIESDRLGKFDDEDLTEVASIIDVYNTAERTYAFSFYLYHDKGKKLTDLRVDGKLLIAIFGETLKLYKLKPAYFNSGSNGTHTAQYQD